MDKLQARDRIREVFEQPFDKERFIVFIRNLLNRIDETKAFHVRGDVKESFRNVIKTYERIGSYEAPDGKKIDIIIAYLQKSYSIHHARVTQRNFAGKYLSDRNQKDAGLFAFVSPDDEDWRFSLVKMEYKFEQTPTGMMKVKEEFTSARRWSFLVGANERSHTAQSRLVNILAEDEKSPTLEQIEEAFNIETVTKEFFREYRDLFIRTKEALDKVIQHDPNIQADFKNKGVNTVDFSKKLMGQIIFLYFLQKKGWFGVARNAEWGTGSKFFLRELFESKHGTYKNFFNDILEPLFYDALSRDRSDIDHWNDHFKSKIPFLNGGLFDPIGNYNWYNTDILFPNDLFSNQSKTKDGDSGDGILDIFDRYNFTVKEDEPLEKEVAIDPELLGKAYEKFNAIRPDNFEEYKQALKSGKKGDETKFNKQFGVYYTPREIVHYMCQQSLISYLFTELNSGRVSLEKIGDQNLVLFDNKNKKGQLDFIVEHRENPVVLKEDIEKLIHHGENVSENEACVESKGKETSTYYYQLPESIRINAERIDQKLAEITVCDLAVGSGAFPVGMMNEIVRARTVLTIFIDQKTNRTTYDFKRRCIEHSIYGVDIDPGAVEIAKLRLWLSLVVDEDDIKNIKPLPNLDYKIVCGNSLLGFPEGWGSPIEKEIESLKNDFFSETNPGKKNELKQKIDGKIRERYANSLKNFGYEVNFDFKTVFSEVFKEKEGFDVVIANPPYIDSERMVGQGQVELRKIIAKTYKLTKGNWDIYIAFFEKGFNLLNSKGLLTYITPDKWISKPFGDALRVAKISNLSIILRAGRIVFEDAKVDAIVSLFSSIVSEHIYVYLYEKDIFLKDKISKSILDKPYALDKLFSKSLELIQKIEKIKDKISDSFICENACATSDAYKIKSLINENKDNIFNNKTHFKIVNTGTIGKYNSHWGIRSMTYLGNHYTYPVVKRDDFFLNFKKSYSKKTLRPKIIIKGLNLLDSFLDLSGDIIPGKTTLIITSKKDNINELKFVLALLNSSLIYFYIKEKYSASSYNQGITFSVDMINNIPFFGINEDKHIVKLVDRIITAKSANLLADISILENEINQLFYKFYKLTSKEIEIIEREKR